MMEGTKANTVKGMQEVVFAILCDIDDFCRSNHIRYYLSGGTCLGAIRHKGFIPWDDDGDIMMPRPDYERFLKEFASAFPEKYGVASLQTDDEWYRPAARVWDKRTHLEPTKYREKSIGIFVDLFPVDGLPKGRLAQRLLYSRIKILNAVRYTTIRQGFWEGERYRLVKRIMALLTRKMDTRKIALKMDSLSKRYPFDQSEEVGAVLACHYGKKETIKRECMSRSRSVLFEGRKFPVPAGYDQYLTNLYGDYMTIPADAAEKGYSHLEGWEVDLKN